jgi:hypothetical protein
MYEKKDPTTYLTHQPTQLYWDNTSLATTKEKRASIAFLKPSLGVG